MKDIGQDRRPTLYGMLFGLFIFANCIFYRDFSYISVGGTLYITEMFVALSASVACYCFFLSQSFRKRILRKELAVLFLFIVWGTMLLVVDNRSDIVFVLKEN